MGAHIKKPWLITTAVIFGTPIILIILIIIFLYIAIDIPERDDDKMIMLIGVKGGQIYQYKKQHKQFPNTLSETSIKQRECLTFKCIDFKYKVSQDRQNFTLAASNGRWIAYYYSDAEMGEKYGIGKSGMAVSEDLGKTRTDLPIYKEDKKIFATPPSAWLDVE